MELQFAETNCVSSDTATYFGESFRKVMANVFELLRQVLFANDVSPSEEVGYCKCYGLFTIFLFFKHHPTSSVGSVL